MKAIPNLDFAVVRPTEPSLKVFAGMLRKVYQNLIFVINGNLGFGDGTSSDNISGSWINTTTPGAANTDFTVSHNLNRLPVGYWIMQKDRAVDIYTGSVAATKTQITLRATVASAVVRLFVICLLFAFGASAQTTNVTLQVTDSGGQSWNNGSWSVVLASPPGTSPFGPPFNLIAGGGTVPNQSQTGALSGTGSATMTLTQNSAIVPGGSQWKYTVCPQATSSPPTAPPVCFSQFVTITAVTTVTLTPPPVTVQAGATTTAYADTEVVAFIGQSYYNLTSGATRVCTAPPQGQCTTWATSGGGAAPLGNNGDLQMKNGALLAASHINDNGTVLNLSEDSQFKGPNPYIDVRSYGARAVTPAGVPNATATTTVGLNTVTLSAASGFQNGDGVTIFGAGAACALTTPGAPTVTPSVSNGPTNTYHWFVSYTDNVVNGPAGSTAYAYVIVARDKAGCLTAASTQGTTATGQASLGGQSVNISTLSRSGNVVTVTTASPHTMAVGAWINIANTSSSPDFGGFYAVASVPDTTHFTYQTNISQLTGNANANGTGGQVYWFNCNHLTWTGQANDWVYYIYGRTAGSLTLKGISRPGTLANSWDDYGPTMNDTNMSFPQWVPNTPPSTPTNDHLVTTILSGGGTTTLTLANAAGASVSNQIVFDDGTAILAAAAAAVSSGGSVYFPATAPGTNFFVSSMMIFPPTANLAVVQASGLTLGETMILPIHTTWYGSDYKAGFALASFQGASTVPINTGPQNPGIYVPPGGTLADFRRVTISNLFNGKIAFLFDQGQFLTFEDSVLSVGNGNQYDYVGQALYAVNVSPIYLRQTDLLGSTLVAFSSGTSPVFACTNCGIIRMERITSNVRSIYIDTGTFSLDFDWMQGCIEPLVTTGFISTGSAIETNNILMDTAPCPIVSVVGGTLTSIALRNTLIPPSSDSGGPVPPVTGPGAEGVVLEGNAQTTASVGNSTNSVATSSGTIVDGAYATFGTGPSTQTLLWENRQHAFGMNYSLFTADTVPPAPTCAVATAGPPFTPAGATAYQYNVVYANGGWGKMSPVSNTCNANGTTQQTTITIPAAIPGAIGYNYYRSAGLILNTPPTTALTFIDQGSVGGQTVTAPGGGPAGMRNGLVWANAFQTGLYQDFSTQGSAPANPAAGFCRNYFDTTSGVMKSINSSGVSCAGFKPVVTSTTGTALAVTGNSSQTFAVQFLSTSTGQQYVLDLEGFTNNGNAVLRVLPNGSTGPGISSYNYSTTTACNVNSVSPAACGAAPAGSFVVPTTTTTYTVNTTQVHSASQIFVVPRTDNTNLSGAPTCVAPPTPFIAYVSGRVNVTSFTITLPSTTGTSCWDYWIVN